MRIGWVIAICQARDQVAQQRTGGKTNDDTGCAGRGEQADAVLLHRIERHQRSRHRDDDDDGVCDPLEHPHLRDVLARNEILGDVTKVLEIARRAHVDDPDRYPADQGDESHDEHTHQRRADDVVERRKRQNQRNRSKTQG
ncbi:hypothetical protein ACVWZW_002563 [Bradyrhizobium sp. F1.13.4]